MINSYHDKHPKSKIPTTFHKNVEKFNCYYLLLLALEGPIFFRSVFTYMLFWGKIGSTFVKCTHSVDKKWANYEKIVQCNNKYGYWFSCRITPLIFQKNVFLTPNRNRYSFGATPFKKTLRKCRFLHY